MGKFRALYLNVASNQICLIVLSQNFFKHLPWRNEQWSLSERQPMRGCVYGVKKVQEMTNSFDLGYANF